MLDNMETKHEHEVLHADHAHHHEHVHTAECGHIDINPTSLCCQGLCSHIEHTAAAFNSMAMQNMLFAAKKNEEDQDGEIDPKTGRRKNKKSLTLAFGI